MRRSSAAQSALSLSHCTALQCACCCTDKILNKDHTLPAFHPDRVVMDVVYCTEIVSLPLLLWTISLYFKRDPSRYVLDAFISGGQIAGAIAYYVPDLILGEHTSVITNVDRCIAFSWIVMDIAIFLRAVEGVRAIGNTARKGD